MRIYLVLGMRPTGRDKSAVPAAGHKDCLVSFAEMSWGKTHGMYKLLEKMDERVADVASESPLQPQEQDNEY